MSSWLLVFCGGGFGAVARYGISVWLGPSRLLEGEFPWATFVANTLACFVLAVGVALGARGWLERPGQLFLLTGFCGGFSTFSTYVLEAQTQVRGGFSGAAAVYVLASLVVGVGVLWLTSYLFR